MTKRNRLCRGDRAGPSPENFRFNLGLTGTERKVATIYNASTDLRALSMNANGDTSGAPVSDDDENEFLPVSGKGQSDTKLERQGPARHFSPDLMGKAESANPPTRANARRT